LYLLIDANPDGRTGILIVRDWPGAATIHLWTQREYYVDHPIYWSALRLQPWKHFYLTGQSGYVRVFVRTDTGEPVGWVGGAVPDKAVVYVLPPDATISPPCW
jgi:hypothetical protein